MNDKFDILIELLEEKVKESRDKFKESYDLKDLYPKPLEYFDLLLLLKETNKLYQEKKVRKMNFSPYNLKK